MMHRRRQTMTLTLKLALAGLAATLAAGCASIGSFSAEVSSFGDWPADRTPGSFAFDRLPSQDALAEPQQRLEDAARAALERAGFRLAAAGAEPELLVQVGARVSRSDRSPWDDPLWWHGGYGRWRSGPWRGPGWGIGMRFDSPRWDREVAVLVRDRASGKPLYEARAGSNGTRSADAPILQAMFGAVPLTQDAVSMLTTVLSDFIFTAGVVYHTRLPFLVRGIEQVCRRHLANQVKDRELREKLTPAYAFGCKRPSFSNTYLSTFNRDDVDLVTDPIARITEHGIVTETPDPRTGELRETEHAVDTLVLATGFNILQLGAMPAFPVVGLGGVELGAFWDEHRYQNYEGVSTPVAPNFWLMNGPWSVTGASWFSIIEAGCRHIVRCLQEARRRGATRMAVKQKPHDEYMRSMRKKAGHTVFVQPSCAQANS